MDGSRLLAELVDVRLVADRLTRESLLEAAVCLLEGEGPQAVTLRGVAREVGVTPPALYRYFDSSADLLEAVASAIAARVEQEVDDLTVSAARGVERFNCRAGLLMSAPPACGAPSQRQIQMLRRDLEDAQVLGELRTDVPTETTASLLRMIIAGFRSVQDAEGEVMSPPVVLRAFLDPYLLPRPVVADRRI
jgi:AcrR family transcriptional regulator